MTHPDHISEHEERNEIALIMKILAEPMKFKLLRMFKIMSIV